MTPPVRDRAVYTVEGGRLVVWVLAGAHRREICRSL
ncbi:type II toxin-antitoxin system RelE/ParE family toxin [Streptomyces sp. NPDC058542]